jgi:AcrR family transcriptional regulator
MVDRLDKATISVKKSEHSFCVQYRDPAWADRPISETTETVMPKLKPDTQRARREHILDAAELCFARNGFHATTMQDICREAAVSAGALYVYFASKEALIAGIAERDRNKLAGQLAELAAAPDLLAALSRLAEYYTVDEPAHKRLLCIEIGLEATRNPEVGRIFRSVDSFCMESFEALFRRARDEGRIDPKLDPAVLAQVIAVLGDGLFWRRAIDPAFAPKVLMPSIMQIVAGLLNPTGAALPYIVGVSDRKVTT